MTRVLVVDDEPQILRTLHINLSARGFRVTSASDGRSALQAVTVTESFSVDLAAKQVLRDGAVVHLTPTE